MLLFQIYVQVICDVLYSVLIYSVYVNPHKNGPLGAPM